MTSPLDDEAPRRIPSYLVVDDSPHGERLHDALRAHGHADVRLAGSRGEAVCLVGERAFDRAVVSARLGARPDGFALARELLGTQPRLRLILLSDYCSVDGLRLALAAGAIDLVLRSHDVPHLQHAFARPERCWLDPTRLPLEPPSLAEAEWDHIVGTVESAAGDPTCAARWLGIDEATLRSKLEDVPLERWSRAVSVAMQRLTPRR